MLLERLFIRFYCLDMWAVYLICGVATVLYLLLRALFREKRFYKGAVITAFAVWCAVIAAATVVSRENGYLEPFLYPFDSYRIMKETGNIEIIRSNIMNIILFYPAGLFLCDVLPRRIKGGWRVLITFLTGALASAVIEHIQYCFSLGRAEVDDVMHNSLGALLGALAALIGVFEWLFGKMKKRKPVPVALKKEERMLLSALRSALGEKEASFEELSEEEWSRFFALAQEQKLLPLVFDEVCGISALKAHPDFLKYKMTAISQVTLQTLKTKEFFALYEKLCEAGLRPVVVKGVLCRSLYEKADHRQSADEDILVSDREFPLAVDVMREYGMTCGEWDEGAFELGFRKKGSPLYVELHKSLFAPDSAYGDLNGFFESCEAEAYTVEKTKSVLSLAPDDNLLYLILHAYKHFIHSGFGIRQAADIALFAKRYGGVVNVNVLRKKCEAAGVCGFVEAVLLLASVHLGIDTPLLEAWPRTGVSCEPMLIDMLCGGVYGSSDMSRRQSATATLGAVEADRKNRKNMGALSALFPRRELLEGRYKILKRHPWTLPFVWVARIFSYFFSSFNRKNGSNARESLRIAGERRSLLRYYKIIK